MKTTDLRPRPRALRFAPMGLVLLMALIPLGCCDECPPVPAADVVHDFYIRPDASQPGRGIIVDSTGSSDITAKPGEYVRWNNEMGADIELTFGNVKRLFGVLKAVSHADGDPLMLRVRSDAVTERHAYFSSGGAQEPGPGVIVCPPSGC